MLGLRVAHTFGGALAIVLRRPYVVRMPNTPCRVASTAVALIAAAALAGASGCGGGESSCALLIDWNGHTYRGNMADKPLVFGANLGQATQKGCDDGGGVSPDQHVTAVRIIGRDPAKVIGVKGDAKIEYLVDS